MRTRRWMDESGIAGAVSSFDGDICFDDPLLRERLRSGRCHNTCTYCYRYKVSSCDVLVVHAIASLYEFNDDTSLERAFSRHLIDSLVPSFSLQTGLSTLCYVRSLFLGSRFRC